MMLATIDRGREDEDDPEEDGEYLTDWDSEAMQAVEAVLRTDHMPPRGVIEWPSDGEYGMLGIHAYVSLLRTRWGDPDDEAMRWQMTYEVGYIRRGLAGIGVREVVTAATDEWEGEGSHGYMILVEPLKPIPADPWREAKFSPEGMRTYHRLQELLTRLVWEAPRFGQEPERPDPARPPASVEYRDPKRPNPVRAVASLKNRRQVTLD